MKAVKIVGGVVATLALGVGVFWFGWYTAPDAVTVCDNVGKTLQKELGTAVLDETQDACVKRFTKPPRMPGKRIAWVALAKCTRDATSLDQLQSCETEFESRAGKG